MQFEVTTIFPLFTHEGVSQKDVVESLVKRVAAISGGVSTWEQKGIEVWVDAVYTDVSTRVVTVVDSTDKIEAIRNVALDAIELLHQRGGVFFQVTVTTVEFLDRDDITGGDTEPLSDDGGCDEPDDHNFDVDFDPSEYMNEYTA